MEKQTYCADDDSTTSHSGIIVCLVSCSFKPRLRKLAVCTAVVCARRRKCESMGCQITLDSQRRPSCNARTFTHLLSPLDIKCNALLVCAMSSRSTDVTATRTPSSNIAACTTGMLVSIFCHEQSKLQCRTQQSCSGPNAKLFHSHRALGAEKHNNFLWNWRWFLRLLPTPVCMLCFTFIVGNNLQRHSRTNQ